MLSARGASWSKIGYLHGKDDAFDPVQNPNGIVLLRNAFNWYMHEDLIQFFNEHNGFTKELCTYGEGYTGTIRLRTAMADHLNARFRPILAIDPEELTFTAGVTDLNEVCSLVSCNPGEAIMLGKPVYGPFSKDLALRTGVKVEYVDVGDVEQFSPACIAGYEVGFEAAKGRGVSIKAMIICNPHNPLGRCYPPETLVALLHFCADKGIHLISDEIYALSTYNRDDRPSEEFTSLRAIDIAEIIDPRQVHVLYGMSKDYSGAGLRLGCIISQNLELTKAVRAICRFSSPSQFSMDLASKFLEDQDFVTKFLQKSHSMLLHGRRLAEDLLQQAGVHYHDKGNAGLFFWVDLSPQLPLSETNDDGWAAERLLSERLTQAGVCMDPGGEYNAPQPGRFRLMFTVEEATLREGIKRIASVVSRN